MTPASPKRSFTVRKELFQKWTRCNWNTVSKTYEGYGTGHKLQHAILNAKGYRSLIYRESKLHRLHTITTVRQQVGRQNSRSGLLGGVVAVENLQTGDGTTRGALEQILVERQTRGGLEQLEQMTERWWTTGTVGQEKNRNTRRKI
nr:serine carboxypeptidase-like 11 isoform X5 [Ipomoea batatas]